MARFLKNSVIKKITLKSRRKTGWWALRRKPIPSISAQEMHQSEKVQSMVTQKTITKALDTFGITSAEKRKNIHYAMQIRNMDEASSKEHRAAEDLLKKQFSSLASQMEFIELTYELHNNTLKRIKETKRRRGL